VIKGISQRLVEARENSFVKGVGEIVNKECKHENPEISYTVITCLVAPW
jgi:hypothetical protein